MGRPDWMVPGTAVAVLHSGRATERVDHATIDRVLKRDVVLDNGERFNADRPWRRRGSAWDGTDELLCADDPRVLAALDRAEFQRSKSELRNLLSRYETRTRDARSHDDLRILEQELTALLASRETTRA